MSGPSDQRRASAPADAIRNAKLEAAIEHAVQSGDPSELVALLDRSSNLPTRRGGSRASGPDLGPNAQGPRANIDLARAVGAAIAAHGGKAERLLRALGSSDDEYPRIVAAQAFAALVARGPASGARRARGGVEEDARQALQEIAEDPRRVVRDGVVAALRGLLSARGDEAVVALAAWTDGYLQAHVALEALAERTLLASLSGAAELVARLDEAFALADVSPRADERLQGLRLLRQRMPAQIAVFAARFPDVLRWLEARTAVERPESREVVAEAIAALRKGAFSEAEAARLAASLAASAKVPRYAARIVQGTRKRSRGRR
jgi:hypothetical protein